MSHGRDPRTLPLDADEFLQIITGTTSDAIVTIDASSTILYANAAVERIFGHRPDDLLGKPLTLLMPEYLRRVHERAMERYLETGRRHLDWTRMELPGLHRDGREVVLEVSFGESLSRGRQIFTGIIRSVHDRTEMEAALRKKEEELGRVNERLLHDTLHDALTGLPNRVLLQDRIAQVLQRRLHEPGRDAGLLFLDFDGFKVINDSLGHAVGDALLIAISSALRRMVRPEDTVARLGGDEFVILIDHVDSAARAVDLAQRIEAVFWRPLHVDDTQLYTSTSIGIVPSMVGYEDADAILRDADTAMYDAKAQGRGRHQVFLPEMRDQAVARMHVETNLRKALEGDQFRILYEPIHRVATRGLLGFEALIHWDHPDRGLLSPAEFLPAATELGIMQQIDWWVWREAARTVAGWRARFDRRVLLSLNFSRQHFLSPGPERMFLDILRNAGAAPDQTVIELDEKALHGASKETEAALRDLSAQGVRVHVDDFGVGHVSLYNLQHFSVSGLKIDPSIVATVPNEPTNAQLVRAIVGLADSLGLGVIAKGVTEKAQLERVHELGCAFAQGPLFSRPLEAEEAVRYLGG